MIKRIKGLMNNQKGLTLVELLAVIVILGIIAAIAVPSIGNIIDNSKKDAHIANAQQLISSAKLAVAANDGIAKLNSGTATVTSAQLVTAGYLEDLADPDGGTGTYSGSVIISKDASSGKMTYTVTLKNANRGITSQTASGLIRDNVK